MDLLIASLAFLLFVGSVIGSIMGNMIASELYDRAPSVAEWLVKRAALRLLKWKRPRFEEEWLAHLDECSGKLSRVLHGLGCILASQKLRRRHARQNERSKLLRSLVLLTNCAMLTSRPIQLD
jgi:hypothetical protein